jgi:hypothetical protein
MAPTLAAVATGLPSISVSASDISGGSGVGQVKFLIDRLSDTHYWNPAAGWTTSLTTFAANNAGSGVWNTTGVVLPSGANLLDGSYRIWAYVYDQAGNRSDTANTITVDATAPAPAHFNAPTLAAAVTSLPVISVTAADNTGGSGVALVKLLIYRQSDAHYWNPATGWSTTLTTFVAHNAGAGVWDTTGVTLPSGANLADGRYTVWAYVYDKASNRSDTANTIILDTQVPALAQFTAPTPNATVSSLPAITGTAADNTGGSGVAQVKLLIYRLSDAQYWNPATGWSATLTTFVANFHSGTGAWDTTGVTLPSGANLTNGAYRIWAYVYDKAGNRSQTAVGITVSSSAAAPATPVLAALLADGSGAVIDGLARPQPAGPAGDGGVTSPAAVDRVLQDWTGPILDFEKLDRMVLQAITPRSFFAGP